MSSDDWYICSGCGHSVSISEFCGCARGKERMAEWDAMMRPPPKPATVEPPEWKGEDLQSWTLGWTCPSCNCGELESHAADCKVLANLRAAQALMDKHFKVAPLDHAPKTTHDWPYSTGPNFSNCLCRKCGLNGQDIRDAMVCDGPPIVSPVKWLTLEEAKAQWPDYASPVTLGDDDLIVVTGTLPEGATFSDLTTEIDGEMVQPEDPALSAALSLPGPHETSFRERIAPYKGEK